MEKKDLDYIDSELKKIRIKDFEYQGNRSSSNPVFVFEHAVNENDFYGIVLNGENDKQVEIEAETSYASGADEYIDKIASLGSWKEAIEYLQNNVNKLVKDVEKKYEYHKKVKAKTASIAKKVVVAVFGDNPHYLTHPEDDSVGANIWRMLFLRYDKKASTTDPEYTKLHDKVMRKIFDDNGGMMLNQKLLKDVHHALVIFKRWYKDFGPSMTSEELLDMVEEEMANKGMVNMYKGYRFDIYEIHNKRGDGFAVSFFKRGEQVWLNNRIMCKTRKEAIEEAKKMIDERGNAVSLW